MNNTETPAAPRNTEEQLVGMLAIAKTALEQIAHIKADPRIDLLTRACEALGRAQGIASQALDDMEHSNNGVTGVTTAGSNVP
jgi:hypothetical protein